LEPIPRTESKRNLETFLRVSKYKKMNNQKLFDKVWYERRSTAFYTSDYEGLYADQKDGTIVSQIVIT
jgi:hypothetical protein